jgi:WhiB family redox-sensing transcriptional regulator
VALGEAGRRWMSRAACADFPADWWFPEGDPDAIELGRVREVCLSCPVRRACLDFAVESDHRDPRVGHGIWAGFTDGQRSSLRRGVCVGCRRNEDPALLWARVGNWQQTGLCGACDALRSAYRSRQREMYAARKAPPKVAPPPPEVVGAEAKWWARQRAALSR